MQMAYLVETGLMDDLLIWPLPDQKLRCCEQMSKEVPLAKLYKLQVPLLKLGIPCRVTLVSSSGTDWYSFFSRNSLE